MRRDAVAIALETIDADAGPDRRAGRCRARRKIAVEPRAIDDRGTNAVGADHHAAAVGRDEAGGVRRADDGGSGKIELGEGIEAEDARAVDGRADDLVLLEDDGADGPRGELARGEQPGRA